MDIGDVLIGHIGERVKTSDDHMTMVCMENFAFYRAPGLQMR